MPPTFYFARRRTLPLVAIVFCLGFCRSDLLFADEGANASFEKQIAPLLETRCLKCHSANIKKGDLSLSNFDDLRAQSFVVPGDPDSSYLLDLITSQPDRPAQMPKGEPPLTTEEVSLIRQWIQEGAHWPAGLVVQERAKADKSWWSLQPLSHAAVPEPANHPPGWNRNPIDRYIYAGLAEKGLTPNPPAEKALLLRRATYDLIGLPPTPEEVAAFLADDSPTAFEKVIDRLLASPQYGEHWGRHWLDVIRFGESRGYERNEIINNLWPLRDFVIRSLNEDKSFNELFREHLAGDVLGPNDPDMEIAAAFLVSGPYDDVTNQDPVQAAQIRANEIDEMISATTEAFLGLTVGCARCHDHKFDPILQRDYYALYATFSGIRHGDREVASKEVREERARKLDPLVKERDELNLTRSAIEQTIKDRWEARLQEHEAQWTRPAVSRVMTEETFEPHQARYIKLVALGHETNPTAATRFRLDEFEVWTAGENSRNVALASEGGKAEGAANEAKDFAGAYGASLTIDGQFGASWIAAGPELKITLREPQLVNRIVFSSDRPNAAGQSGVGTIVVEYRILSSLDGKEWNEVANSQGRKPINEAHRLFKLRQAEITPEEATTLAEIDRKLRPLNGVIAKIPPLPVYWVGRVEASPGPFHIFVAGNPQKVGSEVLASSPSTLSNVTPPFELGPQISEGDRRRALADWIVHPENPLTPRVLANRVWHYHFGTGIVDTPSDFGYMGGPPSHPELLDWLATQLQAGDWKLKSLHKLIMLSQTYQQSSDYRGDAAQIDADSRLLWRFPPRRQSAEEIRDTVLTVAGKMSQNMGGPGFRLYDYLQDNVATYVPLNKHGPESFRRAVYHQNARAARIDLMSDFDSPDCAFPTPRRAETTTPLQALTMMNHHFTLEMSSAFADRLQSTCGDNAAESTRLAYQLCYQREPDPSELAECIAFIAEHGLPAMCRVLLNTSELIYIK